MTKINEKNKQATWQHVFITDLHSCENGARDETGLT